MRITILGAGNIGGTLGSIWATHGHKVVFGVRDPGSEKVLALLSRCGSNTKADVVEASLEGAETVLCALPGRIMMSVIPELGRMLNGKIVMDATNSMGTSPMNNLEVLRKYAPNSLLYRAFSNLGWENFADPMIGGEQIDLFYCGDSGPAQSTVDGLIAETGLRPIYIGGVGQADLIDALTRLWFSLAVQQGRGRRLAFKLMSTLAPSTL